MCAARRQIETGIASRWLDACSDYYAPLKTRGTKSDILGVSDGVDADDAEVSDLTDGLGDGLIESLLPLPFFLIALLLLFHADTIDPEIWFYWRQLILFAAGQHG